MITRRPGPDGTRRRFGGGTSLRTRLLAALVAMVAVVSAIIGVASVLTLRHELYQRVDRQLTAAGGRAEYTRDSTQANPGLDGGAGNSLHRPSYLPPQCTSAFARAAANDRLFPPGQTAGTITAPSSTGTAGTGAYLNANGCAEPLSAKATAQLLALPTTGSVQTVDIDGRGSYRVTSRINQDGEVVVTGLPLNDINSTIYRLSAVIMAVAVAGLLVVTLLGAIIIKFTLRPLRRVAATASRVAELPLDKGEVALAVRVPDSDTDPRTEVGQVGAALNRMLGHVGSALRARQESESRVRQFVADASHELRTPLAAIRGYAELTRRARDQAPPDLAHAMARVESEATRMTGLVDDLLLLARLDEGSDVEHDEVDLTALLLDTVSDAHAAGPDHPIEVLFPEEPVTTIGDEARLHQVLANLLTNARTHTPPGTRITAEVAVEGGDAVLRVADNGPGIPADLQPAVFERFARGEKSRSRAAGSTGLGLAIVASVIAAHGGTVDLTSAPGRTVFTVRLPGQPQPAPAVMQAASSV
jgi:two-component system OmpR family sensor kinase